MASRKKKAAVEPQPESEPLSASWDSLRQALILPRMSDADLRKFVDDFTSDRIFSDRHFPPGTDPGTVSMVFMPLALGALADSLNVIGLFWEYTSEALPRGVNGYPTFASVRMMHREDFERARVAIGREIERRKAIEV
jgi:hypothetical protein